MMIKGIVFDMDGVLADTEHFYQQRREGYLREKGFTRRENTNFVGSNEKAIWEALVPDDPVLRNEMMLEYREYRSRHPEPYRELTDPQVKPLFTELKGRGMKIAIASSSGTREIESMMEAAQIRDLVDFRVSGEECSHHKPNPEIYNRALGLLGLTPDEAFAVEDSPTGIAAALNAGLRVYALKPRHGEKLDQSAATGRIRELREILAFL